MQAEARFPDRRGVKGSWRGALVLVGAAVALIAVLKVVERIDESRHPAVKEHRDQLLDLAVGALSCPRNALTVTEEGTKRARIDGCGRSTTFSWKQRYRRSGARSWVQIDPDCKVDYMGLNLPCD